MGYGEGPGTQAQCFIPMGLIQEPSLLVVLKDPLTLCCGSHSNAAKVFSTDPFRGYRIEALLECHLGNQTSIKLNPCVNATTTVEIPQALVAIRPRLVRTHRKSNQEDAGFDGIYIHRNPPPFKTSWFSEPTTAAIIRYCHLRHLLEHHRILLTSADSKTSSQDLSVDLE